MDQTILICPTLNYLNRYLLCQNLTRLDQLLLYLMASIGYFPIDHLWIGVEADYWWVAECLLEKKILKNDLYFV